MELETATKPWVQNITSEDMPNEDLRFIAENAGINAALALILHTPGLIVSIPKNALKQVKDKYILNSYKWSKYSLNELAVECGVSQRYIYKLLEQRKS